MKKEVVFKIYRHECVDCGHSTWRDYILEMPICSECQSVNPPKVTEDTLVREIVLNDTYTPEQYEEIRRITQEIIDGRPLEKIKGLYLEKDSDEEICEGIPNWLLKTMVCMTGRSYFGENNVSRLFGDLCGWCETVKYETNIGSRLKYY